MPSGSVVRSLPCRNRNLHTRAADGEQTCRLLPVAACLRVLAGACLSIPIHPWSRTRTSSLEPITCEYYLFQLDYMYINMNVCLCMYAQANNHTHCAHGRIRPPYRDSCINPAHIHGYDQWGSYSLQFGQRCEDAFRQRY